MGGLLPSGTWIARREKALHEPAPTRGCSSAGRALQSHCRGQGFDPPQLHRKQKLPLGVTGNTPDSGSGESWFEPRRGNTAAESAAVFLFVGSGLARSSPEPAPAKRGGGRAQE